MELFAEYFKPPYIPQNYAEYINCCQKEEYTSLLEYAELIEVIGALKFKIGQNTDFERKTALKIYKAVFENNSQKFEEYRNNLLLISKF